MANRRAWVVAAVVAAVAGVAATLTVSARGHEWTPIVTHDPQLIAVGRTLLENLPEPTAVHRDRYGSACGIADVAYCATSPTLTPDALLAAVGDEITSAGGARVRHNCVDLGLPTLCAAYYSYRGVQIGLLAQNQALNRTVPAYVSGSVVTDELPSHDPPTPLRSLQELGVVPAHWRTPACAAPADGGCLGYRGPITGTTTAARAHTDALTLLKQSGFRVDNDRSLTTAKGTAKYMIAASKFRTLGGHDRMTVTMQIGQSDSGGFTGLILATADGAPIPPAPTPAPTL
jgi:hypothetical protein